MKQDDKAGEPRLLARRELLQIGRRGSRRWVRSTRRPRSQACRRPDRDRDRDSDRRSRRRRIRVANPATMRVEDWSEPWVWRPEEWPGQPLTLQIVGNRHVPRAVSPGNRFTPLFSFNGASPGPTIRTRGDAVLRVKLRNMLGPNHGQVPKGPTPDPFEIPPDDLKCRPLCHFEGPGGRLLHAADAGARAPRRDPAPHSRHTRGHELPRQPRECAARFAHHEPAHARRARAAGNESERHAGGQHVPARAAQGGLGDPPARRGGMPPHARSARARRRSRLRVRARERHGVTSRSARPGPAPSSRHALVSPALPWRDPRSGRQRPRRLLHHRRRRRRCDQPCDDRNGRGRIRPRRPGHSTTANAS